MESVVQSISAIMQAKLLVNAASPVTLLIARVPILRFMSLVRTTVAERIVETLAELPFIGDQVACLSHDQVLIDANAGGVGGCEAARPVNIANARTLLK